MKEEILKSNKYKYYRIWLYAALGFYFGAMILHLAIVFGASDAAFRQENAWILFGYPMIIYAIFFLPPIIIFLVKLLKIRMNLQKYIRYHGKIDRVETRLIHYPRFRHGYHTYIYRNVNVWIEELKMYYVTKVYVDDLFDQVAEDISFKIAFNPKNKDLIILGKINKKKH